MHKVYSVVGGFFILFLLTNCSFAEDVQTQALPSYDEAQTEEGLENKVVEEEVMVEKRILVIREAREYKDTTVGVEAYLVGYILEVEVSARVADYKPKIDNVLVVGPKLGRLSARTKEKLFTELGEEDPYLTKRDAGLLGTKEKKREKKAKGRLTRELHVFEIPAEKIKKDKRYDLRIRLQDGEVEGQYRKFEFELKDFPELVHNN
ncbi:MAG: hypothetical protein ABIH19_04590 [Candidatus Omnitrophota bacterium]